MIKLTGHTAQVLSVAFSPDGRWFASAGHDGAVRIWERPGYQLARYLRTPFDHARAVRFASDSRNFAAGFFNRNLHVDRRGYGNIAWTTTIPEPGADPDLLPPQDTWFNPGERLSALAIHPNNQWLATADGTDFHVWDIDTRKTISEFPISGAETSVRDVAFSPSGETLAAVGVRRLRADGERRRLLGRSEPQDHRMGYVHMIGPNGPVTRRIDGDYPRTAVFDRNSRLYVGLMNGSLLWWDAGLDGPPGMAKLNGGTINDIACSPDGGSLLIAPDDGVVRLWDPASREIRLEFDWRIGQVSAVAYSPDGLTAAAAGESDVVLWDLEG